MNQNNLNQSFDSGEVPTPQPTKLQEIEDAAREKKYWFIATGGEYFRTTLQKVFDYPSNRGWRMLNFWHPVSREGRIIKTIFPILFFFPILFILIAGGSVAATIFLVVYEALFMSGIVFIYYKKVDRSIVKELEKIERSNPHKYDKIAWIYITIILIAITGVISFGLYAKSQKIKIAERFIENIAIGNIENSYNLLSPNHKRQISLESFTASALPFTTFGIPSDVVLDYKRDNKYVVGDVPIRNSRKLHVEILVSRITGSVFLINSFSITEAK